MPSDDELAAVDEAVDVIRSLGARVVEVRTSTLPAPFTTLSSITTPIVNTEVCAFQYRYWLTRAEDFTLPYRRQVNNGNLLPANAYVRRCRRARCGTSSFWRCSTTWTCSCTRTTTSPG